MIVVPRDPAPCLSKTPYSFPCQDFSFSSTDDSPVYGIVSKDSLETVGNIFILFKFIIRETIHPSGPARVCQVSEYGRALTICDTVLKDCRAQGPRLAPSARGFCISSKAGRLALTSSRVLCKSMVYGISTGSDIY